MKESYPKYNENPIHGKVISFLAFVLRNWRNFCDLHFFILFF